MSKFELGMIVATPPAVEALEEAGQGPREFLARHVAGDWGDCSKHDAKANESALKDGGRIFSVYHTSKNVKIWVITEAVGDDERRASTCILLPSCY